MQETTAGCHEVACITQVTRVSLLVLCINLLHIRLWGSSRIHRTFVAYVTIVFLILFVYLCLKSRTFCFKTYLIWGLMRICYSNWPSWMEFHVSPIFEACPRQLSSLRCFNIDKLKLKPHLCHYGTQQIFQRPSFCNQYHCQVASPSTELGLSQKMSMSWKCIKYSNA